MKNWIIIIVLISSVNLVSCNSTQQQNEVDNSVQNTESNRASLDIYIQGNDFGFGGIIYVENFGQSSSQLYLDQDNIGVTCYPFSTLVQEAGNDPKYRFFRIVGKDTIELKLGAEGNDSLIISSAIPVTSGSSQRKFKYKFIQFYAGPYPERPVGVHNDSTEIGKWENLIERKLQELDRNGIVPQK